MIFVMALAIMLLVVGMMAIGVIMGRKPIAGACGGIASLGIEKECSICGGNREKCEEINNPQADADALAYDATKR